MGSQDPYSPSLDFLRQVAGRDIARVRAEVIKRSVAPAATYRLYLERTKVGAPTTLVLKRVRPGWPDDPQAYRREANFYAKLLPRLELPHGRIYYAGPEPDDLPSDEAHRAAHKAGHKAVHVILMEDLAPSHILHQPTHVWTPAEMEAIIGNYACLHVRGEALLSPPEGREWLYPRHEDRFLATAGDLPRMAADLTDLGIWPPLPGLERLVRRLLDGVERFASQPATLLHNDVTPQNNAMPRPDGDGKGQAVMLDWDMVGSGLAELDLAFMFMQAYRTDRMLDRAAVLDAYWAHRAELEGATLAPDERRERQWYADTLWLLWHLPVAHQAAQTPYPTGSAGWRYWQAMFSVLEEKLVGQCATKP